MSRTCRATITAGFCAALLAAHATATPAVWQMETVSRTVKYSGGDLSTPAGAKRLAVRIRYAADHVCGGESLLQRSTSSFERCRRQVLDRAMTELNAPLVAEALGIPTQRVTAAR